MKLPVKVQSLAVTLPPSLSTAAAVAGVGVVGGEDIVAQGSDPEFSIPPPDPLAALPEIVELLIVSVPELRIAPPLRLLLTLPSCRIRFVSTACTPLSIWKIRLLCCRLMVSGVLGLLPSMVIVPDPRRLAPVGLA